MQGLLSRQELLLGHNLIETTQLTITDLKGAHERIHLREKQSAIVYASVLYIANEARHIPVTP